MTQSNTSVFWLPFCQIILRIVHLTFSLTPPKNDTNLFRKWLNGIDKQVCQTNYGWSMCYYLGIVECEKSSYFQQTESHIIFVGYPNGYALDPYVVLSSSSGAARCHGFRVQPFGDGPTGFIQPVRLVA
jgi:hypothetical protein